MVPQYRLVSLFSFVALVCALLALYMGRPGTTVLVENRRGTTLRQVTLQIAPGEMPWPLIVPESAQIYELGDIPAGGSREVYLGPMREATVWVNSVDLVTDKYRNVSGFGTDGTLALHTIEIADGTRRGSRIGPHSKSILLRFVIGVLLTGTWVVFVWRRSRPCPVSGNAL